MAVRDFGSHLSICLNLEENRENACVHSRSPALYVCLELMFVPRSKHSTVTLMKSSGMIGSYKTHRYIIWS